MKNLLLITVMIISANLQGQQIGLSREQIVEESVGLAEYPLDETKLSTVLAGFGDSYELDARLVELNERIEKSQSKSLAEEYRRDFEEIPTLLEVKYKDLGLSFYYLSTDSTQIIRAVKFYGPFKVRTKEGIVLNESTMGDVTQVYESGRLLVSGNPPVSVGLNKFLQQGISFTSALSGYGKDEVPEEEVLKSQVVDEIYVYNYQDTFLVGN